LSAPPSSAATACRRTCSPPGLTATARLASAPARKPTSNARSAATSGPCRSCGSAFPAEPTVATSRATASPCCPASPRTRPAQRRLARPLRRASRNRRIWPVERRTRHPPLRTPIPPAASPARRPQGVTVSAPDQRHESALRSHRIAMRGSESSGAPHWRRAEQVIHRSFVMGRRPPGRLKSGRTWPALGPARTLDQWADVRHVTGSSCHRKLVSASMPVAAHVT
jgi:hypothetical protein